MALTQVKCLDMDRSEGPSLRSARRDIGAMAPIRLHSCNRPYGVRGWPSSDWKKAAESPRRPCSAHRCMAYMVIAEYGRNRSLAPFPQTFAMRCGQSTPAAMSVQTSFARAPCRP